MNVDNVDFIRLWNKHSGDFITIAQKLNIDEDSVIRRANRLRKLDYPICDTMPKPRRALKRALEEVRTIITQHPK